MIAFISWDDWQRLTAEQRRMVDDYAESAIERNLAGLSFEISQSRLDEILKA